MERDCVRKDRHAEGGFRGTLFVTGVLLAALAAAIPLAAAGAARAESDSQLAQELTNPVADLIQVPFQNNFDWGGGRNSAFAIR